MCGDKRQLKLFADPWWLVFVGQVVCTAPSWLRLLREQVCRSRAQWEWLQAQPGVSS